MFKNFRRTTFLLNLLGLDLGLNTALYFYKLFELLTLKFYLKKR